MGRSRNVTPWAGKKKRKIPERSETAMSKMYKKAKPALKIWRSCSMFSCVCLYCVCLVQRRFRNETLPTGLLSFLLPSSLCSGTFPSFHSAHTVLRFVYAVVMPCVVETWNRWITGPHSSRCVANCLYVFHDWSQKVSPVWVSHITTGVLSHSSETETLKLCESTCIITLVTSIPYVYLFIQILTLQVYS